MNRRQRPLRADLFLASAPLAPHVLPLVSAKMFRQVRRAFGATVAGTLVVTSAFFGLRATGAERAQTARLTTVETVSLVVPDADTLAPVAATADIDAETLWLARCIYSETKAPREQELVAWVIRNRVETGYRGAYSYEMAVLDPYQFSAFNPESAKRGFYTTLTPASTSAGWGRAVAIAQWVKNAPAQLRPFDGKTRHFYSERSMAGGRAPNWAVGHEPVSPARNFDLDADRFRFYSKVS